MLPYYSVQSLTLYQQLSLQFSTFSCMPGAAFIWASTHPGRRPHRFGPSSRDSLSPRDRRGGHRAEFRVFSFPFLLSSRASNSVFFLIFDSNRCLHPVNISYFVFSSLPLSVQDDIPTFSTKISYYTKAGPFFFFPHPVYR